MNSLKTAHSDYYHRRFSGWMEKIVEAEDGKKYIKRIYIGDYYILDLSGRKRRGIHFTYGTLYVLSVVFFIFASSRDIYANHTVVVQILCFVTLLLFVAMLAFLFAYVTAPRQMTVWEYYAGPARVQMSSKIAFLLLLAEALSVIFILIFRRIDEVKVQLSSGAGYLGAGLAMGAIRYVESKLRYIKSSSEIDPMQDGYLID